MFNYPYETTPLSAHSVRDVEAAIRHALVENQLPVASSLRQREIPGVREVPPYVKAVPPFTHPLRVEHFGEQVLVVDTRAFRRMGQDGQLRTTAPADYQLLVLSAALTAGWVKGHRSELSALGDLPIRVFARLLTENIVRRFGLTAQHRMQMEVLSAYYYICLFNSQDKFDQSDFYRIAGRISRATAVTPERVLEVIEPLKVFANLADYCEAVRNTLETSRLEKLNPAAVYAVVGGLWHGASARLNMAVAMEHPPTFLAILFMAVTDRSFHGAFLTKLVQTVTKGNSDKEFTNNMALYLETVTQ